MSLEIKSLSKYFGKKLIFNDFSYTFQNRGIYALIGESGIGKTTLLRIISGLDSDFQGNIVGGGISNTAFAFQEYRLFGALSAVDNVIFANNDEKTVENTLEAENMLIKLGFKKEDTALLPSALSGGMKQRVSLARAFLRNAPLLLLDEPTKELDSENTARVLDIIKSEAQKRTVVIVTHNQKDIESLNATVIELKK